MRKVVAYQLMTVDGVVEAPEEFVSDFDDVMEADLGDAIASQDTVVLGRRTYDEWSNYWPKADEPFAEFINNVQKHVATSTPLAREWAMTSTIQGAVHDFVRELKSVEGSDIGVHGSITLTRSLLAAGLVDEVRLVVVPCVVGSGRRLFQDDVAHTLELIRSSSSPSGSLLVRYAVVNGVSS